MRLLIADDSILYHQYLSMLIAEFLGIRDIEQTEDVPGAIEAMAVLRELKVKFRSRR